MRIQFGGGLQSVNIQIVKVVVKKCSKKERMRQQSPKCLRQQWKRKIKLKNRKSDRRRNVKIVSVAGAFGTFSERPGSFLKSFPLTLRFTVGGCSCTSSNLFIT